jgi:hypothetical protein
MKTKIVYAVVSNDSDIYLEQTLLSVYSARIYMPEANIILLVDDLTDTAFKGKRSKILDYITSKVVVKIEGKYTKQQRSRILKTSIREYIEGDFLFIDSDTIITSSLSEIDVFPYDVGAVKNEHASTEISMTPMIRKFIKKLKYPIDKEPVYFNSGVMYVKDNDNTRQLYKMWRYFLYMWQNSNKYIDQPALAVANILNNHIIHELSGVWNCQICCGLKYLSKSKIIHYWASSMSYSKEPLSKFMDENLYLEIKKDGDISSKMVDIIANPHDYYMGQARIIYGRDVELWSSPALSILRYLWNKCNIFFKFINFISKCIIKISVQIHPKETPDFKSFFLRRP